MWKIGKEFSFEASHQLPHHDGKCARLHGHSWKGVVYVRGEELQTDGSKAGMLMDYADIKKALQPLIDNYLDHWHLNDTLGIENPTSEKVAQWIFRQLKLSGFPVSAVSISETCTSECVYCESSSRP